MIRELARLDDLGAEMSRRARAAGVMLIWRAQARTIQRIVVRNGVSESTTISSGSGHGVQVVTPGGHTALAARDDLRPEPALDLLARVIRTASEGAALGLERHVLPDLPVVRGRAEAADPAAFAGLSLERQASRLAELEGEIAARAPGPRLSISFRAELDAWRIQRSDGTDVAFAMPRCTLGMRATGGAGGSRHGVSATVWSASPRLLDDETTVALFLRRAERAARLARELPDAPAHPAGSYPLVIDYALAKGLAHEAFGHASEADGFRSSVLARDGRFRVGEQVGADHVSIIDEPVANDHAWQPYSANGLPRERAVLVDHGRLRDGLSDPWSAGPGGVRLTAAARAESYASPPMPRMTNIRIECDQPLAAAGEFDDYDPERVRELLDRAGVLRRHPRMVYLSGYSGGQVNATSGDFVFNCKAIHVIGPREIALHRPAIFSGSMIGALHAVREAFGPLRLDAIGYCGKWGQSVPSSGGSHYFLVLDPDPTVRLGGV